MNKDMKEYVNLLSQNTRVSYRHKYKTVDEAIKDNDWNAVRYLIRLGDIGLIDNDNEVAKSIGEKNLYVDDLISIRECSNPTIYDLIAAGAARGGYHDLIERMVQMGANNWNMIAMGAARGGHIDIVDDMVKRGATNYWEIQQRSISAGHMDIANDMARLMI
jgi:hypothetical protein